MDEPNKKRRLSEDIPTEKSESTKETTKTDVKENQPKRTLFVRSLPPSATTDSLAEYFSQSYVIKHATAISDPTTKLCKGYGFVTFADLEDAESAVKELNGSAFEGKKIVVEYAQPRQREIDEKLGRSVPSAAGLKKKQEREDLKKENTSPKLIVRNLPWSIKEPADLALLFRSFGKVKFATLPKKGATLAGFGFVVIRGRKNAEKALHAVNGKEIDGRTLAVDWAVEKEVWDKTNKGDEDEAKEGEEEKESSEDVDMEDKDEDEEEEGSDAEDSDGDEDEDMEELEDLEDDEDEDEDEEEKEDERYGSTIFLRNLPFSCDDEALYDHFKQFGPLRYARIVVDRETERPRGTGFVCFWKPEDASACIRGAPTNNPNQMPVSKERANPAAKHSVLQNENDDVSGKYTLDGRVVQVTRAVNKNDAVKLEDEGVSRRLVRDKDKRRLFLLSEGTIPSNSPIYQKLSPSEIKMREESYKQRQKFIKNNPALHLSLTRLAIRNIPRHITSKDLKQLARQAVVQFATEVKGGIRQPLSKEESSRSSEEMLQMEQLRKKKEKGIVRQATVVYETREGTKVPEKGGGGRSRGYGFIEYYTHRHALMGLRWLNCHAIDIPLSAQTEEKEKRKRLVVEFAIENAQVVKRRSEIQNKRLENKEQKEMREKAEAKENRERKAKEQPADKDNKGKKRKRDQGKGKGNGANNAEAEEDDEENKVAKRNRIIAKKRMQRRGRKGKA